LTESLEAEKYPGVITPAQCRAARGLLRWSQPALAQASGVSVSTINSFELERRTPIPANLSAIQSALEKAGVEFINPNGGGVGVRFKRKG
jgi:transcriptional regulator with XRE-family HTH domain